MLATLLFVLAVVGATVSAKWPSDYLLPWPLRLVGTIAAVAGGLLLSRQSWWSAVVARFIARVRATGSLGLWALACGVVVVSAGLAYGVLGPFPHIEDEAAYFFQARVFASDHLYAAAPIYRDFFPSDWVITHDGKWFAIFPPGWPLMLAAGVALGVPVLVNPLITGMTLLAVHRLVREMYGTDTARWTALLCALSPWFLFMGASFMSHMTLLLFASMSTMYFVRTLRSDGARNFWLAGAFGGMAVLVRPPDAVAIWGAQAVYLLCTSPKRQRLRGLAYSAIGLGAGAALYVWYNHALVGHWFEAPLALLSPHNRMGFGRDIGLDWGAFETPGHNPWRALINLNFNLAVMSQDLLGWPLSSLIFVFGLACFGRLSPMHRLGVTIAGAVVMLYGLYWYHGVCFGARFYFCLLPHLLAMTVDGVRQVPQMVKRSIANTVRVRAFTTGFVAVSTVFAWTLYVPWVSVIGPYRDQRGVNAGVYDFVRHEHVVRGIVFEHVPAAHLFTSGFVANAIPLTASPIIFADDVGSDGRLKALFPDRPVYYYTYTTRPNRWRDIVDHVTWRMRAFIRHPHLPRWALDAAGVRRVGGVAPGGAM